LQDFGFGAPYRRESCPGLTIEVLQFKAVEVGDIEVGDAQSRERDQVGATNTTKAGYGDSGGA
jgi:hypothetical protein